jgi:hypothetical protein
MTQPYLWFRASSVACIVLLGGLTAACSADGGGLSPPPGGGGSGGSGATDTSGGTGGTGTGGVSYATGGIGGNAPTTGGTGGVPATGGVGAGPSTGGALPYGGYDPNVSFDWPDTTPTAGSCKAGSYTGTFAGTYLSPFAVLLPVPITGNVTHRLEQASTGEFFQIKDGRVEGTADTPIGPVPFEADFVGELDCATAKLVNAELQNGTYNINGTIYNFAGPVTADYDKLANQFINGTWTVGEPTYTQPPPLYGGNGTWGSKWTAP